MDIFDKQEKIMPFLIIIIVVFLIATMTLSPGRKIRKILKLFKFIFGLIFKIIKIPFIICFYFMKKYAKKKKLEKIEKDKLEKQKKKLQLKINALKGVQNK